MSNQPGAPRVHSARVHVAGAFRVISGANLGDAMEEAEALCPGDTYRLARAARTVEMRFTACDGDAPGLAEDSIIGPAGAQVIPQARLRFMSENGGEAEALLIAIGAPAEGSGLCVLPLRGLRAGTALTLIGVDRPDGAGPVAIPRLGTDALGLGRGTRVALGDGTLVAVESLSVGDMLLTRDSGAQPLRYVHRRTVPATGPEAPIVIPTGRLGNPHQIVLAQQQRLFFYQQGQDRLTETAEILVRAGALAGAHGAERRRGGYAEYFALVMDAHEILYAEGVPCESVELSTQARERLPGPLTAGIDAELPGLHHRPHLAEDAGDEAVAALTRALLNQPHRSD